MTRDQLLQDLMADIEAHGLPSGGTVDWMWLHEVGCGCDDTELPHHVSDLSEVKAMVAGLTECLASLPRPAAITIARCGGNGWETLCYTVGPR